MEEKRRGTNEEAKKDTEDSKANRRNGEAALDSKGEVAQEAANAADDDGFFGGQDTEGKGSARSSSSGCAYGGKGAKAAAAQRKGKHNRGKEGRDDQGRARPILKMKEKEQMRTKGRTVSVSYRRRRQKTRRGRRTARQHEEEQSRAFNVGQEHGSRGSENNHTCEEIEAEVARASRYLRCDTRGFQGQLEPFAWAGGSEK
jgi:hypothetical protein